MHLLAAQAGAIQQEGEAIDLAQSPGKIIFAGSAESELALFAGAANRAAYDDLRLANLLRLAHNLSVDTWLEKTVRHAELVVLRLLGGPAYWQYGVDELTALAAAGTVRLALFPGEAAPDSLLRERSTISPAAWDRLFALLAAGGPENADRALRVMQAMAAGDPLPDLAPAPLPRFGLHGVAPEALMVSPSNHEGGRASATQRVGPTPSPSLPTRGVPGEAWATATPHAQPDATPRVGEAGRGMAPRTVPILF
jgi:cobaltochelatase CobN